jgi:hypothetical protein
VVFILQRNTHEKKNIRKMIKISSITRSRDILESLDESNERFAYLDDPCNVRYIFDSDNVDLGYFVIYKTDPNNIAVLEGHALIGYQDTARTLINRANARAALLNPTVDLSELVA